MNGRSFYVYDWQEDIVGNGLFLGLDDNEWFGEPAGFWGINCRHRDTTFPFIPDFSETQKKISNKMNIELRALRTTLISYQRQTQIWKDRLTALRLFNYKSPTAKDLAEVHYLNEKVFEWENKTSMLKEKLQNIVSHLER
jgi:hypothetical protein